MKILFLLLASSLFAMSSEIFAWKVPLSHFIPEGLDAPGVVRLETAPEKSPFFAGGDELWNLNAAIPDIIVKAGVAPDWAVWNATSERLLTKVSMSSGYALNKFFRLERLPVQCRQKIDLYRVPEDGVDPDFSAKPDASLNWLSESGKRAYASSSVNGAKIETYVQSIAYDNRKFLDMSIIISVSLPKGPEIEINSSVALEDRKSLWLARDYDGETGIDIRISSTIELTDGTPFSEVLLRQMGESATRFRFEHNSRQAMSVSKKGWLFSQRCWPHNIYFLVSDKPSEIEPLSDDPSKKPNLSSLPKVELPPQLRPYFRGPVVDMRKFLEKAGIIFGDGDIAGYDLNTYRVFMFSSEEGELEKAENLFFFSDGENMPSGTVINTRGNGQTRLACYTAVSASLESQYPNSKKSRLLRIEPTRSDAESILDLRFHHQEKLAEKLTRSLESDISLEFGKYLNINEGILPENSPTKLEIKAEILRGR